MKLYPHQVKALEQTKDKNRVAYYYDMGLGKTYIGSEKAIGLHKNILVICQKSKVDDWTKHFIEHYGNLYCLNCICDLTNKKTLDEYLKRCNEYRGYAIGIINYELAWRRKELSELTDYTLILDESSLIQNETSKRSKFILKKLNPTNVILLSGTPVNGKYEQLWSQCKLLGWDISKKLFYNSFIIEEPIRKWNGEAMKSPNGFVIKRVVGYKNVDRLKRKLREYGAVFMKTEEVLDLPTQTFTKIRVPTPTNFVKFLKNKIVTIGDETLIGDVTLKQLLYSRMLCGHYCDEKLDALEDLINSTNDRLVIFYNFNAELEKIKAVCCKCNREHISYINGSIKDQKNYDEYDDGVILVQYQSGAMGVNLQKGNKVIYFTPPLSSEYYEQSKKRIHRIGQEQPCFYYNLVCGIDEDIYETLDQRKDFTDELFRKTFF